MTFSVTSKGSFANTRKLLTKLSRFDIRPILEAAGAEGVAALRAATPRDSGIASESWDYVIATYKNGAKITWVNRDVENGYKVVIGVQYGHGTGTGGYIQGRDFINPAMRPIFDRIADKVWKAVISA